MYDKILRLETGYAQMRKKNAWFGKSLPAIAAALLPVVAAATPLPPFEDSALAPDLRKRLAEEVPGILAERRAALSNVAARVSRAFAGREDAFQRERLDKRLGIALRLCDFAESQHALGDVSGLAFAQRALDDLQEFGTYFRDELELWKDYPRADAPAKPVVLSLADFSAMCLFAAWIAAFSASLVINFLTNHTNSFFFFSPFVSPAPCRKLLSSRMPSRCCSRC